MTLYEYLGDEGEKGIRLKNEETGKETVVEIDNRFYFTFGWEPHYRIEIETRADA
jgi:hypothetical protein